MAKKTNKTDHVLNLLSGGSKKNGSDKNGKGAPPVDLRKKEPEEPEEIAVQASEEDLKVVSGSEEVPEVSIVHTSSEESPIAESVKNSLEAELDSYLKEKEEKGKAQPLVESEEEAMLREEAERKEEMDLPDLPDLPYDSHKPHLPEKPDLPDLPDLPQTSGEPLPDLPEPPLEEPSGNTAGAAFPNEPDVLKPEEEAAAPEAEEQAAQAQQTEPQEETDEFTMVNVMEALVRDQAPRYMRQFGHCDCRRCVEDTIALALTHLPAKYVVVNKDAVSPLLNFYEKKFAGQLLVEITKASMIINEFPHH